MGIGGILGVLFGRGNRIKETVEIFRENAEAGAGRDHDAYIAALQQLAAETASPGIFGGLVDGLNRLPRPLMAFGTLGLFVFAMADPVSFSTRITALALIPEPMWYLLGGIVGFYFGARELHKRRQVKVSDAVSALGEWRRGVAAINPAEAEDSSEIEPIQDNPALALAQQEMGQ